MPRKVVFIGIFGCSGSGKTSVASQLAFQLHSPFFAISLDRYYDDSKVELYKTAEHFHTIRITECYNDLLHLKAKLQNVYNSNEQTLAENLNTDTSLSSELCSVIRFKWDVELKEEKKDEYLYHNNENNVIENNAAFDNEDESEDESLKAHEEEDYNTRCNFNAFNNDNLLDLSREKQTHQKEELETIYVICEGFVLFCVPPIHPYYELFDVFVEMLCEADIMCYRRFCRTPRRSHTNNNIIKKHENNVMTTSLAEDALTLEKKYNETHTVQNEVQHQRNASKNKRMRQRLMLLWSSRTEEWRQELQKHISELYTSNSSSLSEYQAHKTCRTRTTQTNEEVVDIHACNEMLEPHNYYPPTEMETWKESTFKVSHNNCKYTRDDDNHISIAASAFAQFWQDSNHNHAIPSWSRLQDRENELFTQHLTHKEQTQVTEFSEVDKMEWIQQMSVTHSNNENVWNEYCQFRYWFFFEVYYYYLLFLPCQRHFVHECVKYKEHEYEEKQPEEQEHLYKHAKCLSLTCNNGRDVTAHDLQTRVQQLTESIQLQYNKE